MRAGALRERVTIETPTRTGDGAGGDSVRWTALASVWADVQSLTGSEVIEAQRSEARERYTVTIRFRDDVTAEMRLVWQARVLNIRSLRDTDGRRRWLALVVEGGVA